MSHSISWSLLVLLTCAATSAAGTAKQTQGPVTLELRWDAADARLRLADLLTVTLTVEGKAPLPTPIAPLNLASDAKWQLVERSRPKRAGIANGRERWRLTYRFAPREPGNLSFAFPAVKYRTADGEQSAKWQAVSFKVAAPVGDELQGATPDVEGLPPLPPPDFTWLWIASAAVTALLVVGLLVGWRWLRRTTPSRSQEAIALAALDRLLAKKLHETGRTERFVTLLTLLLRRYLEKRFALPARRRTTAEFTQQLQSCANLSAAAKQFLADFLSRADAVKFANCKISSAECNQWAAEVKQFLDRRFAS